MLRQFNIIKKLGKSPPLASDTIIGDGSYGSVYLVKRISDGQFYALKKVSHIFQLNGHFSVVDEALKKGETKAKLPQRDSSARKRPVSHFKG